MHPGHAQGKAAKVVHNPKARLLDQVREVMRVKRYSIRTEQAYIDWIKRFIFFHGKWHPREMGAIEIGAFLSHLATNNHVAASTQNDSRRSHEQARSATRCSGRIQCRDSHVHRRASMVELEAAQVTLVDGKVTKFGQE